MATAGIFSILQERSMGYEDKDVLRKVTNKRKSTLYSHGVTTILENPHSSYSHELHIRESLSMSQLAFPTSLTFWIRLSGKKSQVRRCWDAWNWQGTSALPHDQGLQVTQRTTEAQMAADGGFSAKNLGLSLVPQGLTSFLFGFLLSAVKWGADSSYLPGFVR